MTWDVQFLELAVAFRISATSAEEKIYGWLDFKPLLNDLVAAVDAHCSVHLPWWKDIYVLISEAHISQPIDNCSVL